MGAYDRVKAALQAAGDAGSDLLRLVIGDPTGADLEWPQDQDYRETFDPGQMWQSDSIVMPLVIEKLCDELDRVDNEQPWAYIDTQPGGQAPILRAERGVASAVKSIIDSPQSLTITLDNSYNGAYWVPFCASMGANVAIIEYTAIGVNTVKIALMKHDGTFWGIDDQLIVFRGLGTLA
jgi:hypothetical protein